MAAATAQTVMVAPNSRNSPTFFQLVCHGVIFLPRGLSQIGLFSMSNNLPNIRTKSHFPTHILKQTRTHNKWIKKVQFSWMGRLDCYQDVHEIGLCR